MKIWIAEQEIRKAVQKAGAAINASYDGRPVLLVSILKGAFIFLADICRAVNVPCEIGFMAAQSYCNGTVSSGHVEITMDLQQDISGYHVWIIEDIIDSGRTLSEIVNILKSRNPASLQVLTLLNKKERREIAFEPNISLFDIPDVFVVGYGMDYAEQYRNLPYIGILE